MAVSAGAGPGGRAASLAREIETLSHGENWHGPTLDELLDGVTAEAAAARPIANGHSIWELVLHVTGWTAVFRRRLGGEAVEEPEAGDFPKPIIPRMISGDG